MKQCTRRNRPKMGCLIPSLTPHLLHYVRTTEDPQNARIRKDYSPSSTSFFPINHLHKKCFRDEKCLGERSSDRRIHSKSLYLYPRAFSRYIPARAFARHREISGIGAPGSSSSRAIARSCRIQSKFSQEGKTSLPSAQLGTSNISYGEDH